MDKKNIGFYTQINYKSDSDKFNNLIIPHPLSVCYKVTNKCNYHCPHCMASSSFSESHWLWLADAIKILDEIARAGIVRLDITWWEPYLRNDMNDILLYAHSLWLELVVTTNGSMLKEIDLDVLKKTNSFVQVSIDWNRELNDQIRWQGTFDTAISTINKLKAKDIPTRINCTIQRKNMNHIHEIISMAKDNNVDNVYFILVCTQWRAEGIQDDICLSDAEEGAVRDIILDYRLKSSINVKILDFKKYARACVLIDHEGNFVSQWYSQEEFIVVGNILRENLNTLWMESWEFDHALHLMQYIRHPSLYK